MHAPKSVPVCSGNIVWNVTCPNRALWRNDDEFEWQETHSHNLRIRKSEMRVPATRNSFTLELLDHGWKLDISNHIPQSFSGHGLSRKGERGITHVHNTDTRPIRLLHWLVMFLVILYTPVIILNSLLWVPAAVLMDSYCMIAVQTHKAYIG